MAQIGIDFGTTNSIIVAYNQATNQFSYFNYLNDDIQKPVPTSSTVWYHDGNVIVGSEARNNINELSGVQGHHFEKSIKLRLGQTNGVNIFGRLVQPYMIAAEIIKHIKRIAKENWIADLVANTERAVFTIPINFNGNQRNALRMAAYEAGIDVTTFIHEPFAAIIGYYFTKNNEVNTQEIIAELDQLSGNFVLTFDWGGGTLDITVVKVDNGKMLELGTSELTGKAGDKFDEDIAWWAWNKFLNKHGDNYDESILENKRKDNWDKLLVIAERCKILLSNNNFANFIILNIFEDLHLNEKITRRDFESLIESTIADAINEVDKAIREAKIDEIMINEVLLVGGTSYIPAVQERMRQKFGYKVRTVINSELLIAQGAAVISEMGWMPFLTKDISIQLSDDSLYPIFEKYTPIAANLVASKSEDLVCVDHRGGDAKIIIVEGDGQIKYKNLAILKVPVLNDSRFNDDIKLDAIIDRNIVLKIEARSFMVRGYKQPDEAFSQIKKAEVHQLSFGLDFRSPN
jgi:molecular chaperone DnaK (HSP70)